MPPPPDSAVLDFMPAVGLPVRRVPSTVAMRGLSWSEIIRKLVES